MTAQLMACPQPAAVFTVFSERHATGTGVQPDPLRLASRQGMPKRAPLRTVIEQGYGHAIIIPGPARLYSHGTHLPRLPQRGEM